MIFADPRRSSLCRQFYRINLDHFPIYFTYKIPRILLDPVRRVNAVLSCLHPHDMVLIEHLDFTPKFWDF